MCEKLRNSVIFQLVLCVIMNKMSGWCQAAVDNKGCKQLTARSQLNDCDCLYILHIQVPDRSLDALSCCSDKLSAAPLQWEGPFHCYAGLLLSAG